MPAGLRHYEQKRRGSRAARAAGGADWTPYHEYLIGRNVASGRWVALQAGVIRCISDSEKDVKRLVDARRARQRILELD